MNCLEKILNIDFLEHSWMDHRRKYSELSNYRCEVCIDLFHNMFDVFHEKKAEALEQLMKIDSWNYDYKDFMSFTWAPDPSRFFSNNPEDQAIACFKEMNIRHKNLSDIFKFYDFVIELTNVGNVHIHGRYVVKDRYLYFKRWLPNIKDLGFVMIKQCDSDGWEKYIEKDQKDIKKIIGYPLSRVHIYNEEDVSYVINSMSLKHYMSKYKLGRRRNKKRSILSYFRV